MLIRCIFRKRRIYLTQISLTRSIFASFLWNWYQSSPMTRASAPQEEDLLQRFLIFSEISHISVLMLANESEMWLFLLHLESFWAASSRQCINITNRFQIFAALFSALELCKHWFIEFLRSVDGEGSNEVSQDGVDAVLAWEGGAFAFWFVAGGSDGGLLNCWRD